VADHLPVVAPAVFPPSDDCPAVKSSRHFLVSVAVGLGLLPFVDLHPIGLLSLAVAAGVGIDVDHFLLARLNTGSWRAVGAVLRDPRLVVAGQDDIFEPTEVWRIQRLFSHVLIGTALVPPLYLLVRPVGVVVGVALYAHLLTDLVADVRDEPEYVLESAAAIADRRGAPDDD
jgi:hypothetical protein